MIIGINENNEIIFRASGAVEETIFVDDSKYFRVDTIPEVGANERLLFNPETKELYTAAREPISPEVWEELNRKNLAEQKKAAALQWLTDNDWKVNKHTLGEWADDDARWLEYLAGREQARADFDEAEAVLNG